MKGVRVQVLLRLLIAPVIAALAVLMAGAPGAQAAADVSEIGAALRESPVYVDPAASGLLSDADADALADKIEDAGEPVFVAVLPADFPTDNLFQNLRTETGITGLYGVRLGDEFDARADSSVLSRQGVNNLVTAAQGAGDTKAQLNDFVDDALRSVRGSAPSSWDSGGATVPTGALITAGAVVAAGGAGAFAIARRNRLRREEEQRQSLERLRVVVDEDITAFGEELDRLDFHPGEPGADDAMRADYEHGLDAYEQAKTFMGNARKPEDVRAVTQSLEDGRFSLARLAARREDGRCPTAAHPASSTRVTARPSPTPPGPRRAAPPARCRSARPTRPGCPTGWTRWSARWTPTRAAAPTGTRVRRTAPGRAATSAPASCRACWSAPCSAA